MPQYELDIIRIEAHNNYSHFYFINRPKIIVCKTLKEFDDQLAHCNFYRVHQSHLINLNYVEAVQSADGDYVLLQQGHKVEISRRKKHDFLQKIKKRRSSKLQSIREDTDVMSRKAPALLGHRDFAPE